MDRMGNVIERIKTEDYDMFRIMNDDFSFTETSQMAYGTIEKQWQTDGIGGEYDYLQVRGDENGAEVFEFLSNNTDVEYAQLKCGEEGEKGLNIIGTSHSTDDELSAVLIIDGQLKYGYNLREYIHNHPSGYLWPSEKDIHVTNNVSNLFNRKPTYKVYTKYAYEGLGNYKSFDNNTEVLSAEEFLERYTMITK